MSNCRVFENIIAKEPGERTVNEELFLQEHSRGCSCCRRLLQNAERMNALLESIRIIPAPAGLSQRIVGRLVREEHRFASAGGTSSRVGFRWLAGELTKALAWGTAAALGLVILGEGLLRLNGVQTGKFFSGMVQGLLANITPPSMSQIMLVNVLLASVVLASAGVLTWRAMRA
jgi:hypothetical protein